MWLTSAAACREKYHRLSLNYEKEIAAEIHLNPSVFARATQSTHNDDDYYYHTEFHHICNEQCCLQHHIACVFFYPYRCALSL